MMSRCIGASSAGSRFCARYVMPRVSIATGRTLDRADATGQAQFAGIRLRESPVQTQQRGNQQQAGRRLAAWQGNGGGFHAPNMPIRVFARSADACV